MKIFENREAFAIEMLKKYKSVIPSDVASDVGSGYGWLKPHIEKNNLIWQPFDYVRKIQEAIIWDLNEPSPGNSKKAGICVMLEVLEHLPNPLRSIKHISDHIVPGGIVILSVPNPSWSRNRLNLLTKGVLYTFQPKHLEEHHVFTTWRHIIEFFFEQNGFEVLEYHPIQQYKNTERGLKTFLLRKVQNYIEKKDPMAIGLSYGLVLRKIQ